MLTLDYISNAVHGELFFEKIFSTDIDWDEQLDRRDTGEFDENWTSNHEIVQNAVTPWIKGLIHDYMEGTFPTSSRVDENGTDE